MKSLFKNISICLTIILMMSCSSDDNNSSTTNAFTLDGKGYSVNISSIEFQNDDSGMSQAVVILTGNNGSEVASISFLLHYFTNEGVSGTYVNGEAIAGAGNYTLHLSTYAIQNGSQIQNGNYPVGEFKIQSNGGNNYSVEFNVVYSDDVQASANITRAFTNP